jgi:hypothetical protein
MLLEEVWLEEINFITLEILEVKLRVLKKIFLTQTNLKISNIEKRAAKSAALFLYNNFKDLSCFTFPAPFSRRYNTCFPHIRLLPTSAVFIKIEAREVVEEYRRRE